MRRMQQTSPLPIDTTYALSTCLPTESVIEAHGHESQARLECATVTGGTCEYTETAAWRKAGLDNCLCRRQTGPSLTRSPLPAKRLPGKKAVPSCTGHSIQLNSCSIYWLQQLVAC